MAKWIFSLITGLGRGRNYNISIAMVVSAFVIGKTTPEQKIEMVKVLIRDDWRSKGAAMSEIAPQHILPGELPQSSNVRNLLADKTQ